MISKGIHFCYYFRSQFRSKKQNQKTYLFKNQNNKLKAFFSSCNLPHAIFLLHSKVPNYQDIFFRFYNYHLFLGYIPIQFLLLFQE